LKVLGVTLDSSMTLDMQVTGTGLVTSPGALCLGVSLVPQLVCGWIAATLCITVCQTLISKCYRECRMLHDLFAKLHEVNVTQLTY